MGFFGSSSKAQEETEPTINDVDKTTIKGHEPKFAGQFKEFLKTVISFTGDLSSLTCPAFFLNGLSLLEYGTYWGDHPNHFTVLTESSNAEERMLAVTRWFISTLYGSYASRCTYGSSEKKPYNPILGEQFLCHMGDVNCVCEQVSHHPPISAFYLESKENGVCLNGHCGQKSKFTGTTIKVEQVGRAVLYLKNFDEQYIIDYPDLLIRGVLTGSCYLELSGSCTIASSSGAKTVIEFIPKPWFGGDYHHIKGTISMNDQVIYTLSGKWSFQTYYADSGPMSKRLLFDADYEPMAKRVTKPLAEQQEIESHRLWGPVTEALMDKNYRLANAEKTKIEEWQRKVSKERESNQLEPFQPALFRFCKDKEASDTYSGRIADLVADMTNSPLLDEGSWTYIDSLHKQQD